MVWEQLLELCNSSAACLAVMLEQEKAVSQGRLKHVWSSVVVQARIER
jgi:hypothetical protein